MAGGDSGAYFKVIPRLKTEVAEKVEYEQNDQDKSEASTAACITAVGVAAAATKQDNDENNEQEGHAATVSDVGVKREKGFELFEMKEDLEEKEIFALSRAF